MAYSNKIWASLPVVNYGNSVVSTDWLVLGYLASTGSNGEFFANFACAYPKCVIKRVGMLVTEAFTAASVIKVWKNGTGGTLIATFTMAATAIGKNVYLDPATAAKRDMDAGDYITFELDVKDTTTGIVMPYVFVEPGHEVPANVSDMLSGIGA